MQDDQLVALVAAVIFSSKSVSFKDGVVQAHLLLREVYGEQHPG